MSETHQSNPKKTSILDRPFTFDRVFRLALTLGLLYALFLLVAFLQDVLIPFAVAALLAYILNPMIEFVQYKLRVKNRIVSILIVLVLTSSAIVGVFAATIPLVGQEVIHMERLLEGLAKDAHLDKRIEDLLPQVFGGSVEDLVKNQKIQELLESEKAVEWAENTLKAVAPVLGNITHQIYLVITAVVGILIIILYLVFILIDYDGVMVKWKDLLHSDIRDRIVDFVDDFESAMSNYFRAQTLIAFLVGILFAIAFSIVGLPLAIVFGLFVGLLNLVPYLQTVAVIPAAFLTGIYCLEHDANFWKMMVIVLAVFAVVQLIQDALLTPRIMGKATGLNPAVMLLALSVWGKLLGMLGLIIALPITFLLVSYYKSFLTATGSMTEEEEEDVGASAS